MVRAAATLALALAAWAAAAPRLHADDLTAILDSVGERVARYYANAQNIVAQESVRIQPENRNMSPAAYAHVLVYEHHVEWHPAENGHGAEASVVRELVKVDGRAPKPPRRDDSWRCFQQPSTSPEPLTMLLPDRRADYVFSLAGKGKADDRPAILIEYKERIVGKPVATWHDECLSLELPGRSHGKIWLDEQTHDVMRVDEEISGQVPVDVPESKDDPLPRNRTMNFEHAAVITKYQLVTFHDPEEALLVPRSIETTDTWNGAGYPRMRITQTFSNYRRFVGESHMVIDPQQ